MKKVVFASVLALLLVMPMAFAQEDEDEVPALSIQGRVGALFAGDDPFESGAAFEVGAMYKLSGPVYLNIFGGSTNFKSEFDLRPLSDDFATAWETFLPTVDITDPEKIHYTVNFIGAGLAVKMKAGRLEPYVTAGFGAYSVGFTSSFGYVLRDATGLDTTYTTVEDDEVFNGYMLGGGINFQFNQIISFAGQVSYHNIDTELLEPHVYATFGLDVKIP